MKQIVLANKHRSRYPVERSANGDTCWVHLEPTGETVGRFSKRFGMDVHRTVAEQTEGAGQCLNCAPIGGDEGWAAFRAEATKHWGIDVPEDFLS